MRFWKWIFKRRTEDQASEERWGGSRDLGKNGSMTADVIKKTVNEEHGDDSDSIPAFMRKNRTRSAQPNNDEQCIGGFPNSSINDAIGSCSPTRQVKGALSFVLPDDRQAELMALCAQLDTHRSDVIRACLEMALPVFKSHPDMYDYFRQRSREGW